MDGAGLVSKLWTLACSSSGVSLRDSGSLLLQVCGSTKESQFYRVPDDRVLRNSVSVVSLMAAAVRKFWGEAREDVKT